MTKREYAFLIFAISITVCMGGRIGDYYPQLKVWLISAIDRFFCSPPPPPASGLNGFEQWPPGFEVVHIQSSVDKVVQYAIFHGSQSRSRDGDPLVVSLHTHSGDYLEKCTLAKKVKQSGWNFIHPDFRGPNWTNNACMSELVISDIDDSIQYAIDNGHVDRGNIFVVGASGGGLATLGSYLKSRHNVRLFMSWVPISDLAAWYYQSKYRDTKYSDDLLKCTSSRFRRGELDEQEAIRRSPLHWDFPVTPNGRIEIYAGINDGYGHSGSVPTSHSILFFNRVVMNYGFSEAKVAESDIINLLTRAAKMTSNLGKVGNRTVLFEKNTPVAALTIFEGGHEMLPEYTFNRIKEIAGQTQH